MRRHLWILTLGAGLVGGTCALSVAQQYRDIPPDAFEIRAVLPHETAPAQYQQVDTNELQMLGNQGWELVAVVPYIYKNEERPAPGMGQKPLVTQTYPAYYFKRHRRQR